jgi:hypothetical protein
MKTKKKTYFPYFVPEPQSITTLEQVFCMVHLAQNHSLDDLRAKQDLIEQQIQSAHQHCLPTENLLAMQDNLSAAVAYQAYPDDDLWMSFIRQT